MRKNISLKKTFKNKKAYLYQFLCEAFLVKEEFFFFIFCLTTPKAPWAKPNIPKRGGHECNIHSHRITSMCLYSKNVLIFVMFFSAPINTFIREKPKALP